MSAGNSDSWVIAPLQDGDEPALAAFLPALLPGDWSAVKLQALMRANHQLRVLRAATVRGAGLAGFAEFQQVLDEGHLHTIAIAPLWQKQGLGRLLLAGVLQEMRDGGCRTCLLEVRRSNAGAQALYARAGFILDGVRKGYYPPAAPGAEVEDALLYSLSLSF